MSYIQFIEKLISLNDNVKTFFTGIIKKQNYSITSMELFLLIKIQQDPNIIQNKERTLKAIGFFKHLKFILQSMEKKNIIQMKAKSDNIKNLEVTLNTKGHQIFNNFSAIKIPKEISNNLMNLELFSQKH